MISEVGVVLERDSSFQCLAHVLRRQDFPIIVLLRLPRECVETSSAKEHTVSLNIIDIESMKN
jgi:hypothetical protein